MADPTAAQATCEPRMPDVAHYLACAECGAAYVLRRCFNLGPGAKVAWLWQRDCKHSKAGPGRIVEEKEARRG